MRKQTMTPKKQAESLFPNPITSAGAKPSRKQIAADMLIVYPEVQRDPPSRESILDIASHLDFSALGTVTVNERTDGTYSLLDGQRRVAALKLTGNGAHRVECSVYHHLTQAQEAELFLRLNTVRVATAKAKFFPSITAKRPDAVGVVSTCNNHGWKVGKGLATGTIVCVDAAMRVWRCDMTGDLLGRAIDALTAAFGKDKHTVSAHTLLGMAKFLRETQNVDFQMLAEKLSAKFAGASSLVVQARARQASEGGSMAQNVAELIGRAYSNRKVRT